LFWIASRQEQNPVKKATLFLVLAALMLASCRAVEMVPPPDPSPVPSATTLPTQEPAPTMTQIPPDQPVIGTPAGHGNRPTQPFDPKPGDAAWQRGTVFLEGAQVLTMESLPPQFTLLLSGNLPTPCNQLRVVVMEPDANKVIQVDAYSVVDPNKMCTQVLAPFQANVPMGTFATGKYQVTVNGQEAGQIQVP
jgi:hypothetical protein